MKLVKSLTSSGTLGNGKVRHFAEWDLYDGQRRLFTSTRPVDRALRRRQRANSSEAPRFDAWRTIKHVLRIG